MIGSYKPCNPINEETTILFQAISERSSYSPESNHEALVECAFLKYWLDFIDFHIQNIHVLNWHYHARRFYEGMITHFDLSLIHI